MVVIKDFGGNFLGGYENCLGMKMDSNVSHAKKLQS